MNSQPNLLQQWGLMALLGLALSACGSSAKSATTPNSTKAASATSPGMSDDGPNGDGGTDANQPGAAGGSTGAAGDNADAEVPAVVVPNLDPDPMQVKSQVVQHLQSAKAALERKPPDADTALREAMLALSIDAASIDAAAMVALAYYHKRLYDTAELVLDDVFKREAAKQNASIMYVYGLVYDKTNRAANAQLAYTKALELDANHVSASVNLGAYMLKNKQYEEATRLFERVTQQFGRNDAIVLTSLGSAYRGRAAGYGSGGGERDMLLQRAEDAYKRAVGLEATYAPAYYNLGLLYLDADPFPTASGPMDTLARLQQAKNYFDYYKAQPGAEAKLYEERIKDVTKAVKREEKQRKKASKAKAAEAEAPAAPPSEAPPSN